MTDFDYKKDLDQALERNLEKARADYRAHREWWHPLKEKIWEDIEHELARKVSESELWMGGTPQYIRMDYFYGTDAELSSDEKTGQQQIIVEAIQRATKKHINVAPEVWFHSHQFIRDKCDGDYFRYFR